MKMKNLTFKYVVFSLLIILVSCKKEWLDQKYDIKTIVPTTLTDMRLLLNNTTVFQVNHVGLSEIASDNVYLPNANYTSASIPERGAYTWAENVYGPISTTPDWDGSYKQVFTANIVLEGLENLLVNPANLREWNDVKGAALFFRAKAFFDLIVMYTKPYDSRNAKNEMGIPIRLSSLIAAPVSRMDLEGSYLQVVEDLKLAVECLRVNNTYPTNPSKLAALGLLARVYLSMGLYAEAKDCADKFLSLNSTLLNFSEVNVTLARPFTIFNAETISYGTLSNYGSFNNAYVDTSLVSKYHANDIRLQAFFKSNPNGLYNFKGNYSGSVLLFSGLTPAEMFLTRAECNVRLGFVEKAIDDMNKLLVTRYKIGTYLPLVNMPQEDLLKIVLIERRKELVFRGIRWMDLKRLTLDPLTSSVIRKSVDQNHYTLDVNSNRYAFAIPDYIISISKIPQNPR